MNLFADECVYRITVEFLRLQGHDVVTAQEAGLVGHENGQLLAYAVSTGRTFVTTDMHFSNVLLYPPSESLGIIILRTRPRYLSEVHCVLAQFLKTMSQEQLAGALVIVDRKKYRFRRG